MNLDFKRDFKNTIWQSVAENICARHGISCNFPKRSEHRESIVAEIDETLRKRLMLLTCFYEWSDLRRYAVRLRPEAVNYTLKQLETAIWNFC